MKARITFAISEKEKKMLEQLSFNLSAEKGRKVFVGDLIRRSIRQVYFQDAKKVTHSRPTAKNENIEKTWYSMGDVSRILKQYGIKIGRNKLFAYLRKKGYLKTNNRPYPQYGKYFKVKTVTRKTGRVESVTYVEQDGLEFIKDLML
jgi:phage antirepressor YoqD-like protein